MESCTREVHPHNNLSPAKRRIMVFQIRGPCFSSGRFARKTNINANVLPDTKAPSSISSTHANASAFVVTARQSFVCRAAQCARLLHLPLLRHEHLTPYSNSFSVSV